MTIEKGEYFAVIRGFEYNTESLSFLTIPPETSKPKQRQFDRSYEGDVFECLEVCGPLVCGRMIATGSPFLSHREQIGKVISFNTGEVELWPVTPLYVDALKSKESKP